MAGAEVEQQLEEMRRGIEGVTRASLRELQALRSPPDIVTLVLSAVCVVIGEQATDWQSIRRTIMLKNS